MQHLNSRCIVVRVFTHDQKNNEKKVMFAVAMDAVISYLYACDESRHSMFLPWVKTITFMIVIQFNFVRCKQLNLQANTYQTDQNLKHQAD